MLKVIVFNHDGIEVVTKCDKHKKGQFMVDFMYRALLQPDVRVDNNKKIWHLKIPLKTIIFARYLRRGVILTTDNLIKRNWHGSSQCVFCHHDETIKYL